MSTIGETGGAARGRVMRWCGVVAAGVGCGAGVAGPMVGVGGVLGAVLVGCGVLGLVGVGLLAWGVFSGGGAGRVPGVVWAALRDFGSGLTPDVASVLIDPDLGVEAAAWNGIIRERLEREAEGALDDAGARSGGGDRGGPVELDHAFGMLAQGVMVIGPDGRIDYVNAAASVFLNAPAGELTGKAAGDVGLSDEVLSFFETMRSGKRRQRASVEQHELDESGVRSTVLRFSARPSRDLAAQLFVTVEDVTQQRLADEARNALIASATHELRTPLTNINLYIEEIIDADADDVETRTEAINVISKEARRLERTISDLLSVSEMEAGTMRLAAEDIRLDDLLPELELDFKQQAEEKSIGLVFDLPPRLPVLRGDRGRFELILHNLLGNALKYTPSGGRVTVSFREVEGSAEFSVSDTGVGIDADELEKVFERFYRATSGRSEDVPGTGLGLTIAREIARRHGGDIVAESVVGEGSTFTLRMPMAASARAA